MTFALSTNDPVSNRQNDQRVNIKWKSDNRDNFVHDILNGAQELEHNLQSGVDSRCDPDLLVSEFTDFLNKRGEKYFKHVVSNYGINDHNRFASADTNKQRWFNEECKAKRTEYIQTVYQYNLIKNIHTRTTMLAARK